MLGPGETLARERLEAARTGALRSAVTLAGIAAGSPAGVVARAVGSAARVAVAIHPLAAA